jgi:hypothetical protein
MTPFVPRVAPLNSQSPASPGEGNGVRIPGRLKISSSIAAVTVLALSSLVAEMALRRNRNRRKCTTKHSVGSIRRIERVFEPPVRPAVEQMAKILRPSVPQTPEIAPALAAVPIALQAARLTEPSDEQIRLRAYFISEHRRRFAIAGDADSDWREAKQQLLSESGDLMAPEAAQLTEPSDEEIRLRAYFISEHRRRFAIAGDADSDWREAKQRLISESGELNGRSTITAQAPSEIPARTKEIALAAAVTSAEAEVGSIDRGEPMPYETTFTAIQSPALDEVTESASDCPNAISSEPVFPQTTAPATMPETTQMPTARVNNPPATAVAEPQPSGMVQTSVQLTFSFEIAAMQLTPTFKMGVLQLRPISKIVAMRLAPSRQPQPEVSFEIAKIQPVGETLGTIRVTPSQQQRPIMGSPSFMVAGLQLVPNVEATPVQLTPSQQGQAAVFVTIPCQITTIEFSPLLEIASVVLNSSSKQVLVQLAGAGPSPADRPPVFEIADLQLSEGGDAGMIRLNLLA